MISVILCAAGKGERAGFAENKVLRAYNGLPVLCYSLSAFTQAGADEILIACRKEDEETVLPLISPYPAARIVRGGDTRTQSVYNALKKASGEIVLIHDAARPFVTQKIIRDCIASVTAYGSGVCALPATDTAALAKKGYIVSVPARESVYAVQTPQGFLRDRLLCAYEQAIKEDKTFTDDSGVFAAYDSPPRVFTGSAQNRKLTFAEDFCPAERVGFGIDTHAFAQPYSPRSKNEKTETVTLAGIQIPSHSVLIAHSDGDVLVHALMDALLSAAGLRDIGCYFPDTDEAFAKADSMKLLNEVMRLAAERGLQPQNVSISVLAETPRLSPYIERMRQNLANALDLPLSSIGIAAGTNEKLGYVGEGKGITVYAAVLLKGISHD